MNIGMVTTWFERGAAYVSRAYLELLKAEHHEVFIYARGGEKGNGIWNQSYVTWNKPEGTFKINKKNFFNWIKNNSIEAILFNEEHEFDIVCYVKKAFPEIKLCAYVDYYTEATLPYFNIYDFVICNTKRHMEAMETHPQKYYVKWGTDIELFKPKNTINSQITFFHSAGMSTRKGTEILIEAFIEGELYKRSKLIIHTQIPIDKFSNMKLQELNNLNITIIKKTITAPGLYYLGDVYVYPTRLDGLGLTMYEALASGLPVITTDYPPMNEVIDNKVGKLVKVKKNYCRHDGYYWPMSICDQRDLIEKMEYYINNPSELYNQKINARKKAVNEFNLLMRAQEVSEIFINSEVRALDETLINKALAIRNIKRNNLLLEYIPILSRIKIRYQKLRKLKLMNLIKLLSTKSFK